MNVTNDLSKTTQPTQHDKLHTQAQKWVSQTFFGTMLKQMRNNPFKSDLFSGGRGGQAFGEMFDQQLSDRMSRGSGSKIVNSIVKSIEKTGTGYKVLPGGTKHNKAALPLAPSTQIPTTTANAEQTNDFKNVRIHVSPDLGS